MRSDKKDKNLTDQTSNAKAQGDKSALDAKDISSEDKRLQIAEAKASRAGEKSSAKKSLKNASGFEKTQKRAVRIPSAAAVYSGDGKRVGKVRSGVWYGGDGKEIAAFAEYEGLVCLRRGDNEFAFLDNNGNIFDFKGGYVATLRRFPALLCALAAFAIVALTAFFVCLGAYFMKSSEIPDYAPVMFVADGSGENFDGNESLNIFYNDVFGTQKIAPGMSGSYAFTVRNENADVVEFSLQFTSENEYGIDLVFALSRDGNFIAGEEEKLAAEQVSVQKMTIQPHSETVFVLDWEWRDNDVADTDAGENGAHYKLNISFIAQVWQG